MSKGISGFHPFIFLFGCKRLSIPRTELEATLNLCRREQISYRDIRISDELAELCVPFFSAKRLLKSALKLGLSVSVVLEWGLPALIHDHRSRIGIPIGLVIAAALIALSGTVIWDIRVDGTQRLSEEEVKAVLEECGLTVGKFRRKLDTDVIENRALILSDDISWISVNIIGTVAEVEIRELVSLPEEELPPAANVVSDSAGVIVGLEDVRGNVAVEIGDVVSRGQLLIGGVWGDDESGFRYTAARGKVFAECVRELSVSVERKYEKKTYTGREKCEKYIIFFKKEIKFFTNSRNLYTNCDKIDIVEYLHSPSGDELPVGIHTVRYLEYEYESDVRSDDELSRLAAYRLDALISTELKESELLGVSEKFETFDDGCILTRKIRCIRDIALRQTIDIRP